MLIKKSENPIIEFCIGTKIGIVCVKADTYFIDEMILHLGLNHEKIASFSAWEWIVVKEQMVVTS